MLPGRLLTASVVGASMPAVCTLVRLHVRLVQQYHTYLALSYVHMMLNRDKKT